MSVINNKEDLAPQKSLQRSNSSFIKESDFKTPLIHKNYGASRIGQTLEKYKQIQSSIVPPAMQKKHFPIQQQQKSAQSQQPKPEAKRSLSYYGNLLTEGRPFKLSDYTDIDCIIEPDSKNNTIGGLYLGNINGAKDLRLLKEKRIGAVLTVMMNSGVGYKNKEINQMVINVDDADYVNLQQHFDKAAKFIDQYRKTTNVFVHCYAGISRSASITIAYIMQGQSLNFSDAFQFVKKRRKIISPNCGFQRQLKSYEYMLKERNLNLRKQGLIKQAS